VGKEAIKEVWKRSRNLIRKRLEIQRERESEHDRDRVRS
jgi:hypothetical protein